jgi:hypothetical protein
MISTIARRMWRLYEPIHDVTYFAPEARAAADRLGMRGFWMGYFAFRAAPLGQVGPAPVAASFFGFHPRRVSRALPYAWTYSTAEEALAARLAGVDAALRRLWSHDVVESAAMAEAAELAWRAAAAADCAGRVLAAANQVLPRPAAPHLALWQATSTLREHRGDGHNAVLVVNQVTPPQAHLLKAAAGEAEADVLRVGRGWVEAEWRQAVDELSTAGLLDGRGELTESGAALRKRIEAGTDAVAMRPWELLGEIDTARLADLLTPLAAAIIDSGTLPMPNAVGLTRTLAVGAQPTASARGAAESSSGHSSAMTASNGSTS